MRLHSNIFLWIFFATVLPLLLLTLVAISFVQTRYVEEVNERIHSNLNNLAAEVRRHFDNERQTLVSLAESAELHAFFPALQQVAAGRAGHDYRADYRRLSGFLRAYSRIQPGLNTLRVLDTRGNTLVKVRSGESFDAVLENFNGLPYVEQEVAGDEFGLQLEFLTAGEVANLLLPQRRGDSEFIRIMPMLDHIIPLEHEGVRIGYLTSSYEGESIDRILDYAPRMHEGKLLLAELNPDDSERNGMLIYRDEANLHLAQVRYGYSYLQELNQGEVWQRLQGDVDGSIDLGDGRHAVHFVEFQPYRNTLVSWLLAIEVDGVAVVAPFNQIRYGIWFLVGVALLFSLFITRIGSRHIAEPVCQLAANLKDYADGKGDVRVEPRGAEEIRQLALAFNYMAATLDQARDDRDQAQARLLQTSKLASLGQMAAGIGHEINNPLNNILSYSKLIERDLAPGQGRTRRDLNSLREEAVRASEIVRGILNFSRQVPARLQGFDACAWLDETLRLVQSQAERRSLRLEGECRQAIEMYGDRGQLQQVLVNVLLNAIHASPEGEVVTVRVYRLDQEACIEVEDHGHGIRSEDLAQVFDPFFSTKAVGEGSGLGLSISLGIVQQHGGTIHLENRPAGGVRVVIRLPLVPKEASDG